MLAERKPNKRNVAHVNPRRPLTRITARLCRRSRTPWRPCRATSGQVARDVRRHGGSARAAGHRWPRRNAPWPPPPASRPPLAGDAGPLDNAAVPPWGDAALAPLDDAAVPPAGHGRQRPLRTRPGWPCGCGGIVVWAMVHRGTELLADVADRAGRCRPLRRRCRLGRALPLCPDVAHRARTVAQPREARTAGALAGWPDRRTPPLAPRPLAGPLPPPGDRNRVGTPTAAGDRRMIRAPRAPSPR